MYYEINVSLNGMHLFATHERSINTREKLKKVYIIFKEKFPESEGYNIMVTSCSKVGKVLSKEDLEV